MSGTGSQARAGEVVTRHLTVPRVHSGGQHRRGDHEGRRRVDILAGGVYGVVGEVALGSLCRGGDGKVSIPGQGQGLVLGAVGVVLVDSVNKKGRNRARASLRCIYWSIHHLKRGGCI